jgi:predicted hydrocarbon binding protein
MFKEERDECQFEWSMSADIEAGRPHLGPMVHVSVYRLMQFALRDILIRDLGVEKADKILFEAGKKAGQEYCENILTEKTDLNGLFTDLQNTMKELGVGIFRVESADFETGSFMLTVAEDLDCSAMCSETNCAYEEGFIAGLLLAYPQKDFQVKQVDYWGFRGGACRFAVDSNEVSR